MIRASPLRWAERLGRLTLADLWAAWWGLRAVNATRRRRPRGLVTVLPRPPLLPISTTRAVVAILRRRKATCLEQALVLQRWMERHGEEHDVVIGVSRPGGEFKAHAWLDGVERDPGPYQEMLRLPARGDGSPGRRRAAVEATQRK